METSVIIPTYKGKQKLPTILKALEKQTYKNFELIIVIDGSNDGTYEWLETTIFFKKINIIQQQNRGRAGARNAGAAVASGTILIFYDDDMEPDPNSVAHHVNHQQTKGGIIGGNQQEYYDIKKTDIQNYKAHLCKKWFKPYKPGLNVIDKNNLFLTAANVSIQRELFWSVGGFDEQLTDGEDQDLAYRALEANIKVYFDAANIAVHHDPITVRSYIKRIRQYKIAHLKIEALHPHRYVKSELSLQKKLMYRPFAMKLWPVLIDSKWNVFLILPEAIRYKFYDIIIQALGIVYTDIKV